MAKYEAFFSSQHCSELILEHKDGIHQGQKEGRLLSGKCELGDGFSWVGRKESLGLQDIVHFSCHLVF